MYRTKIEKEKGAHGEYTINPRARGTNLVDGFIFVSGSNDLVGAVFPKIITAPACVA